MTRFDTDGFDAPLSAVTVFPRDVSSVSAARAWLCEAIDDERLPPERLRDAVLLLSELVTNALRHAHGDIVCHGSVSLDGTQIRIAVGDASELGPELLPVDPERVGGIGVLLLERIADRWGVAKYPGGKVVWATLPDHP
jgi:anti-sigma regulatory factor (Ser/Thr protein kinase)